MVNIRTTVQDLDLIGSSDSGRYSNQPYSSPDLSAWVSVAVIFAVVTAVILPMAFMGIPDGFDLMQHMRFAAVYHDSILNGSLTPGWAANDNYGFGSIGLRYYPPLAYYVLALTKMITGSWYDSFWLTSFGWTLLGGVGVYFWVREWTENWKATIAAVVYTLVPYHTFQIYQAVLYAEFAAAGILPFCFLFLLRLCKRSRWIDVLLFSISYSALILTHIPSTIIATLSLAVYGLLIMEWRRFRTVMVRISSALMLSLLATSFYLSRVLTEINWVMHSSAQYFATGYYDYKRYLFPIFWSSTPTRYVERMLWHIDLLVLLTVLLFLPSVVVFLIKKVTEPNKERSKMDRSVILTGLFSIFMLTVASSSVWYSFSILQKIQFPWRWLLVVSLMGSVAMSAVVPKLIFSAAKSKRTFGYPILFLALLILIFSITQNIIPSAPVPRDVFAEKIDNMYNEEGCDCWWPIWASRGAFTNPRRADAGEREAIVENWDDESRDFLITDGQPGNLRVATFYHPYWMSIVNGHLLPVQKDENGAILIPLPAETANVHLFFKEPEFLRAAKILSLFTWVALLILLAGYYLRFGKNILGERSS